VLGSTIVSQSLPPTKHLLKAGVRQRTERGKTDRKLLKSGQHPIYLGLLEH
jgi:hypothetical protein